MMNLTLQLCVIVANVHSLFGLAGDNVCNKTETYSTNTMVKTNIPVRVRSSGWCIAIPPRCSQYHMVMREVLKEQVEQKTRQVMACCEGYYELQDRCVRNCSEGITSTQKDPLCDEGRLYNTDISENKQYKAGAAEKNVQNTIMQYTINNHVVIIPKLQDESVNNVNSDMTNGTTEELDDKGHMTPSVYVVQTNDIDNKTANTKQMHENNLTYNFSTPEGSPKSDSADASQYKIDRPREESNDSNDKFYYYTGVSKYSDNSSKAVEELLPTRVIQAVPSSELLEHAKTAYTGVEIASASAVVCIAIVLAVVGIVRMHRAAKARDSTTLRKKAGKKTRPVSDEIKAKCTYKRASGVTSCDASSVAEALRTNRVFACSSCARIIYINEKGDLRNILNQEHACRCQTRSSVILRESRPLSASQQQLPKPPSDRPNATIHMVSHAEHTDGASHYENIEKSSEPLYAEIKPRSECD